jgi:CheY-like chemotaxis protein
MNPPSILIVDDHPIYRDALCEKLTIDFNSLGVEVLSASSLEEAVSTISRGQKNWLIKRHH